MAVREFDGVNNFIRFTGAFGAPNNGTNGLSILLVVRPLTNASGTAECFSNIASAASGAVNLGSIYQDVATAYTWGADNPSTDAQGAGLNPSTSSWAVIAVTKGAGVVAPRLHYCPLGGTPVHAPGSITVGNSSGASATNWFFGEFPDGTGFRDFRLAAAAFSLSAFSDAQVESVQTARTTAAINALSPLSLIEFNQSSVTAPVDLKGVATQAAITGTSVVTGDDPPSWVFGLGVSGSSSASGPGMAGMFTPQLRPDAWF